MSLASHVAKCVAMIPPATSGAANYRQRRAPYLVRALRSTAFGTVIGICLAFLRGQNIFYTLLYSICISLSCWFWIDLGRRVLVGWLYQERLGESAPEGLRGWPGWGKM